MNEAELFAGALYTAVDVMAASTTLADLLKSPQTDTAVAGHTGLDATLVDSLRELGLTDPSDIDHACALGASWVLGRRSFPEGHTWEVVAGLPGHLPLPDRLHRTTAETLIGLANGAVDKLRFAAPFMDAPGLGYIADSVVAATLREVTVEIVRPVGGKREQRAVDALHRSVDENGNPQRFTVLDTAIGAPFPHLKVMTVDGKAAYIGSSNLTAAAFEGRNLELGVVVHGSQVQVIDEFLDMYTTREA